MKFVNGHDQDETTFLNDLFDALEASDEFDKDEKDEIYEEAEKAIFNGEEWSIEIDGQDFYFIPDRDYYRDYEPEPDYREDY